MNKIVITIFLLCFYKLSIAQWNNSGNNSTTGSLYVDGSIRAGEFYMVSSDGQTHFSLQKPTSSTDPFRISLGYNSIDRGIMIGREDWLSKLITPWKVGIGTNTPQKMLDVDAGANNYASIGSTISPGQFSGLHFGYLEENNIFYRKSALVFERSDNAARGSIHLLNNGAYDNTSASLADARLTIDYNGKVGIGTTTPSYKLEVKSTTSGNLRLSSSGSTTGIPAIDVFDSTHGTEFVLSPSAGKIDLFSFSNHPLALGTANAEKMRITQTGKVGIGLTDPEGKLHLNGVAYFGNENGDSWHRVAVGGSGGNYGSVGYGYKYTNTSHEHIYSVADYASQLEFASGGFTFKTASVGVAGNIVSFASALRINQDGNVGVGTTSPDAKLAVKGTIHTQEVRVDLLGAVAPDYVFEENYDLPSLEEVEAYIKQNKHLPEIPSAKEMEENGVNLKEMNMLLLKKVEELTLHLIEQKKIIDDQQAQNINQLERLNQVEALLKEILKK